MVLLEQEKIDSYATKISARWQTSVESILEVARLCAAAKRELSTSGRDALIQSLPFSAPAFSKLSTIGGQDRLYDARVTRLLPASPFYS